MVSTGEGPPTKPSGVTIIKSTDDNRVVNNTMRHKYRVLSELEKNQMANLKDTGILFIAICDKIGSSRELSIAKTKMEEAVMWAVKSVTA